MDVLLDCSRWWSGWRRSAGRVHQKKQRKIVVPRDGPCHSVELLYTYLMASFTMHCPSLIKPREEPPKGTQFAFLHHSRTPAGAKTMLRESERWFTALTTTTSSGVSPTFLARSMEKSLETKGTTNPHLGKVLSNGWLASDHLICCTIAEMSASWSLTCLAGLHVWIWPAICRQPLRYVDSL